MREGLLGRPAHSAGERGVVLLHEDRVVEAVSVADPAAPAHRRLLQLAQPRRGLARVENARARALDRPHVTRGERRHAREVRQEVERDALSGKYRGGYPGYLRDRAALPPLALRAVGNEDELGVDALEDRLRDPDAGDHAGLL